MRAAGVADDSDPRIVLDYSAISRKNLAIRFSRRYGLFLRSPPQS